MRQMAAQAVEEGETAAAEAVKAVEDEMEAEAVEEGGGGVRI